MRRHIPGGGTIATARRARYRVTRHNRGRRQAANPLGQIVFWVALVVVFFVVIL